MKNNLPDKNTGTAISILAALAFAVLFWLIVKYIDSGEMEAGVTAFISDICRGAFL